LVQRNPVHRRRHYFEIQLDEFAKPDSAFFVHDKTANRYFISSLLDASETEYLLFCRHKTRVIYRILQSIDWF
jgi:hypothetical protein